MSKDKHGLNDTDASTKDRMKFDPTWRIMQKDVRDCFEEFVPGSEGTVMLLQLMSQIYEAYCEINLVPLERIFKIWHALFLIRCWRHKCIELKSVGKECITSNAYQYLELDAHGLVLLAEMCRDCPEQFLVLCFSSQPAEEVFRELRSMTATNETACEFSMKELGERLRNAFMKSQISYRRKNDLKFNNIIRKQNKYPNPPHPMPTDDEVRVTIEKARVQAAHDLLNLGITTEAHHFMDSMNVHDTSFEFVTTGISSDVDSDSDSDLEQPSHNIEFVSTDDALVEDDESGTESNEDEHSSVEDEIYDAEQLFANFKGELKLRNSSTTKHTYRIRDSTGKIHIIKKSKVVWMLSRGRSRPNSARLTRYRKQKP
ncbi:uncharacterized protein LOC119767378 [Culex quinquefasciatus]|uniref:uncharacterized protein LOC119767378 n=1 Tax=Culex quinquefasciatus TaxID=7176 RepID=UPI0018E33467|nr:uncharacterized protein LOC119767378 [Culex quinquefasciatus]